MRLRNNIFAAALDELKRRGIVKNQKDLAQKMGVSEDTVSRIIKDRTDVSEDAISRLQTASGCIFNLQWLRGESNIMFAESVQEQPQTNINPHQSMSIDVDFYHKAFSDYSKMVADLRKDIEYYQQLVLDKDSTLMENNEQVISMRSQVVKLETELEHTKTTLAAVRKNYDQQVTTIKLLQAALAQYKSDKFPYSAGVADGNNEHVHIATDGE